MNVIQTAQKYIGYLEHSSEELLGVFNANVGRGGYTIFAYFISKYYRWRNFYGVPWCALFVHSVFIEAFGKARAKQLLGKPHPGSRVLYRRLKRKGQITDIPSEGCIAFLTNGTRIDHCGIVVCVEDGDVITVEGNTTDPTGIFEEREGGAVAQRVRKLTDPALVCYGKVGN